MDNEATTAATAAAGAVEAVADAVSAATGGAAGLGGLALWLERAAWFILVPMVYLALLVLAVGVAARVAALLRAPAPAYSLRTFPASRRPFLAALGDTFAMPQVRRHKPLFWVFLLLYHLAFLFLILNHLDLFPRINLVPADSKHMLGRGAVGVLVTLPVLYFLFRRFRSPVREISVPGDYLLLLLLLFIFLFGDSMSWSNSWGRNGFVLGKQDFAAYFGLLASFSFADPRAVLPGSHYHFVVLHVLLANLFLMILPFTKIAHTFFAVPVNLLRRR